MRRRAKRNMLPSPCRTTREVSECLDVPAGARVAGDTMITLSLAVGPKAAQSAQSRPSYGQLVEARQRELLIAASSITGDLG